MRGQQNPVADANELLFAHQPTIRDDLLPNALYEDVTLDHRRFGVFDERPVPNKVVAVIQNACFIASGVMRIQDNNQIEPVLARVIDDNMQMAALPIVSRTSVWDVECRPLDWKK